MMLQTQKMGKWIDLYRFDLSHVFPSDINYGNHYTSTRPDSLFVMARVAALPVKNGGVTLLNYTLSQKENERERVRELAEGQPYLDSLNAYFRIELNATYEKLRPLPQNRG